MLAELASADLPETHFTGRKSQVCSHPTSDWLIFGKSFTFLSFLPGVIVLCHHTADYVTLMLLISPEILPCSPNVGSSRADIWLRVFKHGSEPACLFPKCSKFAFKKPPLFINRTQLLLQCGRSVATYHSIFSNPFWNFTFLTLEVQQKKRTTHVWPQ